MKPVLHTVPCKPSSQQTSLFPLLMLFAGILVPAAVRAQAPQEDPGQLQLQLRARPSLLDPDSAAPTHRVRGVHYRVNPVDADNTPSLGGVHPNNTSPTCNSPKLSYFGGPVISNVQPVVVFWSSHVNSQLTAATTGIAQFLTDVQSSPLFGVLTQYSTIGSAISDGSDQWIGSGNTSVPAFTLVPSRCAGTATCTVTDDQIQSELNAQIDTGALPPPTYDILGNDNTVYMTYFPPNVKVTGPDGAGTSCVEFCAYHNTGTYSFNSKPLVYGILMDQFTSACATGCGGNATDMENQTSTSSHELAEAITDADIGLDVQNAYANPAAWGDNSNDCGEIADICDSNGAGDTFTVNSRTWTVQELWSNKQNQCESSGIVTLPYAFSSPGTVNAGVPFNLTVTAKNPTGGTDSTYQGTVHFTSSDPSATLPGVYTYTTADAGVHTFQVILDTGTSQTVAVNDTNPTITSNTTISINQSVQVTVGTSPAGLSFSIDGTPYSTTQTPTWTIGTSHTIATNTSVPVSTGIEDVFTGWSDGGALSHSVTASGSTTSYTANFGTAFELTIAPNNGAFGSVTPATGSFYTAGSSVAITATAAAGYYFTGWTGSADIASASSALTSITMNSAETVTADFAPIPILVVTTSSDDAGVAANCTVQTTPGTGTDAGCTLRDALAYAGSVGAGNISFDHTVFAGPATIILDDGTLTIPSNTTVAGPTMGSNATLANLVTINAGQTSSVVTVGVGVTGAGLNFLNLTGGFVASNGGGIVNGGTLTLSNCSISGNTASSSTNGNSTAGGGIWNTGTMTISNCTISGNSASAVGAPATGGGIQNSGNLNVYNSTIVNNTVSAGGSGQGGGIFTTGTGENFASVVNSTISGNSADGEGGGIFTGASVTLANSIVSGNSQASGTDIDDQGTLADNGGNLISASGINLAALGSYGGPAKTVLPLPGSVAICGGLLANASGLTADQRGFSRTTIYSGTPCVDSGAVQTNYALTFSVEPPSSIFAGIAISPAPVVELMENGTVTAAAINSVSMTDTASLLSGTLLSGLSSGSATFTNLVIPSVTSNDELIATLALTTSLNVTANSSAFQAVSPAPSVSLSATSLPFGNVDVGLAGGSASVTLTNTGSATLLISSIGVTGANASSFVFANNCGTSLGAGSNCSIHGHFAPTAPGAMTAAVTITDNAGNSPQSIALSGTGVAAPGVSLSATSLSFGSQSGGTTSGSQSVTLTNTGDAALSITSITVTGANASSFVFSNSCGSSVAAGANCTIHGHFGPMAVGALTAAITIVDNAPNSPQSISLSGTGVANPVVALSANSLSFGSQSVGSASGSQTVTLTNTGNAALFITSIAVTGTNASSFVFANSCGTSVAAGGNCTIHGHFAPATTGILTAAITITDNASNSPQSISLSGTGLGVPVVSLSAASLSFGSETLGNATGSQTVTLTNTGTGVLSIATISVTGVDASSFVFANNCGSNVAVGANCTIHGHFAPAAAGAQTAAITITDNAGNSPQSISLTGTGVSAGPAVSLSAVSLSFGTEGVGGATASQSVTLTNTGGAALTITSIALTGANASSFVFANSCGSSLAAGANCSIHGHFAPTLQGALTAAITITDNATGSPQSISLSGTGQ